MLTVLPQMKKKTEYTAELHLHFFKKHFRFIQAVLSLSAVLSDSH